MSTQQGPQVFRIGGSVLRMSQVLTVSGFGMSGLFIYTTVTGQEPGWPAAAITFLGALLMLGLCLVVPGVMTVSEGGIEIKRRFSTQRLRWSEIQSVRWSGHGHGGLLTSLASDNWQVWIDGRSDGKPVKIFLSGPSVERQAQVRALLAERLPSR